jgi:alkylation response protein AidB-like acyl-CoA dehydrogenase
MATRTATSGPGGTGRFDAIAVARELGPTLAQRAAAQDADDTFVADSYADFKQRKLFSAGVPVELGGGGATHPELCAMLQEIGRCCGSSALALSMHTHLLATTVWFWRHGATTVEPLLRRVAAEELILVSSGGSDWLDGSGNAEKVVGGFRINARKIFASGSPSGRLLLTTAVYEDPMAGATVLYLQVPLDGPGVRDPR